jgi:hypothetical protein
LGLKNLKLIILIDKPGLPNTRSAEKPGKKVANYKKKKGMKTRTKKPHYKVIPKQGVKPP